MPPDPNRTWTVYKLLHLLGLPNQQMDGPEGWQLVIAFPPGTAPETVQKFINQLRGNEFSTLQFRSAVAPVR